MFVPNLISKKLLFKVRKNNQTENEYEHFFRQRRQSIF